MIAPTTDPVGVGIIEALAQFGYDYIELSLAHLEALPKDAFTSIKRRVADSGIHCEACNNFFPPRVRLTGNEAKLAAALDYVRLALERAAELGVGIVVFGSSGAKNVPPGFPKETAWKQIVELLQHLGPIAEQHQITIAIEPLNQQESNIVNRASEGLQLVREVNHPSIQLLIDYYHLVMEQEAPEIILEAGSAIRHLHFARVEGRTFPAEQDNGAARFFANLRRVQYSGRCSVEAYTQDFASDAPRALRFLKTAISEAAQLEPSPI
jgi:sugar phosphate isomerase/epimerase